MALCRGAGAIDAPVHCNRFDIGLNKPQQVAQEHGGKPDRLTCRSKKRVSVSWTVLMRFFASGLFLLAHGLLVLEHIALGTALHGVAEVFLAPWALRHRAWDLIVIGLIFCVFDLWGTLRLINVLG
ncbi:hypothetical protein SynBIOSE41_02099 [Synechococcus sp. BIOS-E4-1]|nr:hypothetical protein SynBIOSE41_02099 [Synechococcus sp. BIOS-E4-1]